MDKMDPAIEQQFDLNLIEAVKMNPVIYDRSHMNYKHFVRKAQTWKQIAESLGVPEQKCTKRWKSLRDKFARELKISQDSRWRYFKQMSFLMESIRQYRESLLGKVTAVGIPAPSTTNTVTAQVEAPQQTHQHQQTNQQVVDLFTTPFNGSATITTQALAGHQHAIVVTGDAAQLAAANNAVKEQKTYYYEPAMKRERIVDDDQQQQQQQQQQQTQLQQQQQQHHDMLSSIKIFQNSINQGVSAEDQSFGMVVTDMLNTLGVRQKAEAKVHIIKYLTDMQLLAQHNKYWDTVITIDKTSCIFQFEQQQQQQQQQPEQKTIVNSTAVVLEEDDIEEDDYNEEDEEEEEEVLEDIADNSTCQQSLKDD